jgi:hypothetical protein
MTYGTINADVIGTSVANTSLGAGNASIMKNRIINGAMVIDQRNAGASVSGNNSVYGVDRFRVATTVNSKFTMQQNAGSITPPVGFTNYFGITSSSAYSVTSTDYFLIGQPIEGFNTADLQWGTANAKTVTLSFWVRSSLTGTFGGSFNNSAYNRSYPFSYTISSANTWTQISVTIAGDTTGTWESTNGTGIFVWFGLGVGSTNQGTANTWAGAAYYSPTGATSVVGTNGATFYITGVQLEVGSSATGFEYRQYSQELSLCQRYFQTIVSDSTAVYARFGMGSVVSANIMNVQIPLKVTMRTTPSMGTTGTASNYYLGSSGNTYSCNAVPTLNTFGSTSNIVSSQPTTASTMNTGYAGEMGANNASGIYLQFSAEL